MASITHSKVSAKSDGGDSSLVRPSDWNAAHVGGMVSLPTIVQAVQGAHGSGSVGMTITQPATTSLLVWICANNGSLSTPALDNFTFTQREATNVGGVGNLSIFTGVYDGSGTPGTAVTSTGGGGLSGALIIEVANASYVGLGSDSIYAQQTNTNHKTTDLLIPQDVGSIIAFIAHTAGSAGTESAPLSCPWLAIGNAAQPLAFGVSLGFPVMGYYNPGQVYYTLAEVRISY